MWSQPHRAHILCGRRAVERGPQESPVLQGRCKSPQHWAAGTLNSVPKENIESGTWEMSRQEREGGEKEHPSALCVEEDTHVSLLPLPLLLTFSIHSRFPSAPALFPEFSSYRSRFLISKVHKVLKDAFLFFGFWSLFCCCLFVFLFCLFPQTGPHYEALAVLEFTMQTRLDTKLPEIHLPLLCQG